MKVNNALLVYWLIDFHKFSSTNNSTLIIIALTFVSYSLSIPIYGEQPIFSAIDDIMTEEHEVPPFLIFILSSLTNLASESSLYDLKRESLEA